MAGTAAAAPANNALPALADSTPIALQVSLNGYPTGLIGEFSVCGQQLCVRGSELEELGFAIAKDQAEEVAPLRRAGVDYILDWAAQEVAITATPKLLKPQRLGDPQVARPADRAKRSAGAFVTYDAAIHVDRNSTVFNGLLDTRVFAGNYSAGARFLVEAGTAGASVTRLETALTWSNVDRLERVTVGDSITSGLAQTRPVRFAGFQFARAFEQRPDLITYPLPEVRGQVAVPSNVAVLVNGVQRLTQPVAAGPFYMDTVPVSPGAGAVSVVTRDALGNALRSDMQVYVSEAMLRPGLTSFSLEAGFLRKSFAGSSNDYSSPLGSFTGRVGLAAVTLEGHAEFAPGLAMTTLGGSFNVADFIDVTAHAGASASHGAAGASARIGIERRTPTYRIGVSAFLASSDFRDLAALGGDSRPELSILANAGVSLGGWGSFSITHLEEQGYAMSRMCCSNLADSRYRLSISSLQYSVSRGELFWSVNAFRDGVSHATGISTSLSYQFSARRQASASLARNLRTSYGFDFRQTASQVGELGWHLFGNLGSANRFGAEAEFKSALADIGAAAFLNAGDYAFHARASGSLVVLDGTPMIGPPVRDSFAMVNAGAGGIPVYQDGRRVGTTNGSGRLLLPDVPSYVPVRVSADETGLESGLSLRQNAAVVTAMTRQGAGVTFALHRSWSALVTLVDALGKPLPVGTRAQVGGSDRVVGYDGELFVESDDAKVTLSVMPTETMRCDLPLLLTTATTAGQEFPTLRCG